MDATYASDAATPQAGARKLAPLELKQPASPQPWLRYKVDSQGSSWPQADWNAYSTLTKAATPPQSDDNIGLSIYLRNLPF